MKPKKQKKIFTWTGALILVGIILVLNFIISFVSWRLDTSEGRIYSISQGSVDILQNLEDTLLIQMVFSSKLPPQLRLNEEYVRDILSEYKRAAGGKVRIEFFDPGKSNETRLQAIQMGVSPIQVNIQERDRVEVKEAFMGLALTYGTGKAIIAFIQNTNGLEYEITQRIKKLVFPRIIKIGVVTNGETLTFEDESLEQLGQALYQLYDFENVDLSGDIPKDIEALWVIGPATAFNEEEISKLRLWVNRGRPLGLLLDRFTIDVERFSATPIENGFDGLLAEWGVELKKGLVVDLRADQIQVSSARGQIRWVNVVDFPYFPLAGDLDRSHPVTKDLDNLSFPFVSPLEVIQEKPGLTYRPLVRSSRASWLDPKPAIISPFNQRHAQPDGAPAGPFPLVLLMEGSFTGDEDPEMPQGRVALIGNSRLIRGDFPPKPQNYTFFMNLMDWSVQDEALLAIRSKGVAMRPLKKLGDKTRSTLKFFLMLTLPLLSLILGLIVWKRQKTRRAFIPLIYKE